MKIVSLNKKAFAEYDILDRYTAGIVLTGDEVKSARAGHCGIADSFAVFKGDELFMLNAYFAKYSHAFSKQPADDRQSRKLLLTKQELRRLLGEVSKKGLTIIPLKLFFHDNGLLKIEIGLAKHKKIHDRKQELKERDLDRQARRDLKSLRG